VVEVYRYDVYGQAAIQTEVGVALSASRVGYGDGMNWYTYGVQEYHNAGSTIDTRPSSMKPTSD